VATDVSNGTNICNEKHYTPQEVADTLNVSVDTVVRWFSKEPGVIAIGNDERMYTRKKKLLRIPHSALVRFHEKNRTAK
jgi:hypothetical protein